MKMLSRGLLVGIAAAVLYAVSAVQAQSIQFEGVAPFGGLVRVTPTAPYQESGFTFTPSNEQSAIFDSFGAPAGGNGTDLLVFESGNLISLTASNGSSFDLIGLQISKGLASVPFITFEITGFPLSGQTVSATYSNVDRFRVVDVNFAGVNRVTISASGSAGIDNVRLRAGAQLAPEPGTGALAGSGLCAFALTCRRRRR